MTRWTLSVTETTDQNLRAFLGGRGAKKGALSRFVEEAVLEKIFVETAKDIKDQNAEFDQTEIMASIDSALEDVRAGRS